MLCKRILKFLLAVVVACVIIGFISMAFLENILIPILEIVLGILFVVLCILYIKKDI